MFFLTASDRPLAGTTDQLPKYEEWLTELDLRPPDTRDVYWEKIRDRLLDNSVSKDLPKAIREWARKGKPYASPDSQCELCDKEPITWNFPIYNKARKKALHIGSECIVNFLHVSFKSDIETIRAQTIREIKSLRRKQEGRNTRPQAQAESDELLELERAIRDYAHVAGTGEDFPILRHLYALNDILRPLSLLGVKSSAMDGGQKALLACLEVKRLAGQLAIDTDPNLGIVEIARVILTRRNLRDRKPLLLSLRKSLDKVFQGRPPNDVVVRLYDDFDEKRQSFVREARTTQTLFESKLDGRSKDFLRFVEKYPHLHFVLEAGITSAKGECGRRRALYEAAVLDKDLLDRFGRMDGPALAKLFDMSKLFPDPDLHAFTSNMARAASHLLDFLYDIRHGEDKKVVAAVADQFKRVIHDEIGVQAALLQAADDSLVLPESRGRHTIEDFIDLIGLQSPGIVRLLIKEVDDLENVRFGEAQLFDRMSKDLGFDVEDTLRFFDAYNDVDAKACRKLVSGWQAGRKPAPDDLRLFLTRRSSKPEKPKRSMLDQLRSELGSDVGWIIKQARMMAQARRQG